jgi:hypothetical protein
LKTIPVLNARVSNTNKNNKEEVSAKLPRNKFSKSHVSQISKPATQKPPSQMKKRGKTHITAKRPSNDDIEDIVSLPVR